MNYLDRIEAYLALERQVLENLDRNAVNALMNLLEQTRLAGKRVYICGNGGSAATASHFVCDFMKGVSLNRPVKFDFECLNDNVPLLMAIANGNSENVIRAIGYANAHGANTAALVGYSGGKLKELAGCVVHVQIDNMQVVEDIHMILDHMMMYILANTPE